MISRRSFLAALAALPFVGKFVHADNASLAAGDTESALAPARRDRGYPFAPVDLNRGDLFVIEGSNAVNPITQADSGRLQRFVVTVDVPAGESVENVMWPTPLGAGHVYQNVTRVPAQNARMKALRTWDDVFALKEDFA